MRVVNLASGSDGNVTYLDTENVRILLDIGLSCCEVQKRLELLNVSPESIDAIIVTHEHADHIKGVDVFSSKFNIPVYAHRCVWQGLEGKLSRVSLENRRIFDGSEFSLKDLTIVPIEIPHDVPCFGFSFENNGHKVSILTDLGHTNERILRSVQGSQIVYLEANYDKMMLGRNTKYPLILKRRIAGPNGHLSNDDAAEFIVNLVLTGTKQVILSHLSHENNSPDIAFSSIKESLKKIGIIEGMHLRIDVAGPNPGVCFKFK